MSVDTDLQSNDATKYGATSTTCTGMVAHVQIEVDSHESASTTNDTPEVERVSSSSEDISTNQGWMKWIKAYCSEGRSIVNFMATNLYILYGGYCGPEGPFPFHSRVDENGKFHPRMEWKWSL